MNSPESNNVHVLTRDMDEKHLKNATEAIQYMKEVRKEFSDEVVEFAMEQTVLCLKQFGALGDVSRCKTQDFLMLENSIASLVYRYYNIEHPLHPISDDIFIMEDDEDDEGEENENEENGKDNSGE